jgi:phage terminase large subunit
LKINKIDFKRFYEVINKCYWNFFEDRNRIRLLYGSAGSGKSFYITQEMLYKILTQEKQNFLVIRKVGVTLRNSCFALTEQIISEFEFSSLFRINKTDLSITCIHNGNMIIYKGMDDREKIKSVTARNGVITSILIEEATEISIDDFNQLNVRLRGLSKIPFQIILLFNPISVNHWLYKEFFLKKSFQKNYDVTILKTTFKQNDFIDPDYKNVLESYKDIDEQFYRVYCLAEFGVYGNTIFNNYTLEPCPYSEDDFDSIYVGLDFGFSHPQVAEKIGFKDGTMYSYNELCVTEKTNQEFIDLNEEFDILHKGEHVVCDSAEPSKIKELIQKGYGAIGAVKGKDSISRGIDFLKSQKWIIDADKCPRLAQEVEQYHWKKDKEGNTTDKPVELFEDAIHACFYALEQLSRSQGKPSVLSGSKSDAKKGLIEIKKEERKKMREAIKEKRKAQREIVKEQDQKQKERRIV